MFAQANIRINILTGDSKQILTKLRARKHDLCLATWVSDYCDPHNNALTFAYNPDNSNASTEKTKCFLEDMARTAELLNSGKFEHDSELLGKMLTVL